MAMHHSETLKFVKPWNYKHKFHSETAKLLNVVSINGNLFSAETGDFRDNAFSK